MNEIAPAIAMAALIIWMGVSVWKSYARSRRRPGETEAEYRQRRYWENY